MERFQRDIPSGEDRILFVDDDESVRSLAEMALRSVGIPFDLLGDGAEAWRCFQEHRHSVVFTDLQLPGLSGEEILSRIKQTAPATEVIVVTGYPSLRSAIATFKGGASDYLLKPVQEADLRRRVERSLQSQRLQRELVTEKMLRRKFEELSDLKTQFLANVSHELRTPLQVILGYADLVAESLTESGARGDMTSLIRNARALSDMVEDLLMLTQIDAGRFGRGDKSVDIKSILEQATAAAVVSPEAADLEVAVADGMSSLQWRTDPELLERLVKLLVANSVKFTSEGRVTVAAALSEDRNALEVTVADTGIGIPEELIETVFEDFRQADGSSTRRVGGMGVGLALARRIVGLLGGAIRASNRDPRGTEFRVVLPARGQEFDEQESETGSKQR